MKNRINVLIHYNLNDRTLSAHQMTEHLCGMVSSLFDGQSLFFIRMEARSVANNSSKRIEMSADYLPISNLLKLVESMTYYVSIMISNDEGGKVQACAMVAHSHTLPRIMIGREQSIFMEIDCKIWQKRSSVLIDLLKTICKDPKTSYLAIDRDSVAPRSIYTANLRLLAKPSDSAAIDPESRVPGLYWTQYISDEMLSESVRERLLASAAAKGSCFCCERIGDGLWLQTSHSLRSDSAKNHRAVYVLLDGQTYMSDPATIEEYLRLEPWLFEKHPLRPIG